MSNMSKTKKVTLCFTDVNYYKEPKWVGKHIRFNLLESFYF